MRSWISAYMKLSGSEDAVQCGDKEGRNDDHAFWLQAAETGETFAKKKKKKWREREKKWKQCYLFAILFSRAMKNPSALQHITACSFQLCIFHWTRWAGEYYQPTDENISFYIYNLWFNVQLFWYFKNHSNTCSACSFIINHEMETLWYTWSKLVHQLKLNKSF